MKNIGEMFAQRERLLGAGPEREAVAFEIGHGRVRLHGKMLHPRKGKSVFENMIGFLEAGVDIAVGVTKTIAEIGAAEFLGRFVTLPHQFAAAGRRTRAPTARCRARASSILVTAGNSS